MIDELVLFKQLQQIERSLFIDYQQAVDRVQSLWHQCVARELVYEQVPGAIQACARWQGVIGSKYHIKSCERYQVVAIDGSQVYPDRHEGMRVALINTGGIWLLYDQVSQVHFFCQPQVFLEQYEHEVNTAAGIDAQRHAQELAVGVEQAIYYLKISQKPLIVLFDGALIFWHLENDAKLCDRYFAQYCAYVKQLCDLGVLCAWYTSLPKSRDLVRIMQACVFREKSDDVCLALCNDTDILENWLSAHERTVVFESAGVFIQKYPAYMRPYFFYVHSGAEIARVEIPACLAQDEVIVNTIAAMIIDQCIKGDGYPVSLAEAHEQVVVKQRDRLLFQKYVYYLAERNQSFIHMSRKLMKKRSLAI